MLHFVGVRYVTTI